MGLLDDLLSLISLLFDLKKFNYLCQSFKIELFDNQLKSTHAQIGLIMSGTV